MLVFMCKYNAIQTTVRLCFWFVCRVVYCTLHEKACTKVSHTVRVREVTLLGVEIPITAGCAEKSYKGGDCG